MFSKNLHLTPNPDVTMIFKYVCVDKWGGMGMQGGCISIHVLVVMLLNILLSEYRENSVKKTNHTSVMSILTTTTKSLIK